MPGGGVLRTTRNKTFVTFSKDPAILHPLLGSLTQEKGLNPGLAMPLLCFLRAGGKQPEPRSFRAFAQSSFVLGKSQLQQVCCFFIARRCFLLL